MSFQEDLNKPDLVINKSIIYKDKPYPIDFDILKKYSTYFNENRKEYKKCDEIIFSKNDFDVSEASFQNFISFCQMSKYQINKTTIFDLYYLSIKFGVGKLEQKANEYISKNYTDLIFQSISFKNEMKVKNDDLFKNKMTFDLKNEEEILISHFFELIDDEKLHHLPVDFIYKIINSDELNINKLDQTKQDQLIQFLFKCLDHHGRKASILFLNLDVENQRINVLNRLQEEYSKIFDFNMLNPKFLLKSVTDLINEMKTLKVEYSEVTKDHETQTKNDEEKRKELQELHEKEIKKIEQKFAELNQRHEENIKSYKEKYEEVLKKYEEQMGLEEKKRQEILKETDDQINKLKLHFEEIINQQNKIIEEQKTVVQSIQTKLNFLNLSGKLEVFKYEKGKEFEGIMRNLSNKIGREKYS